MVVALSLEYNGHYFPHHPMNMDNDDIQKKCEQFLSSLGVPGFIVFGWQKADAELGMVYSFRDVPVPAAIKGLSWALYDFSSKTL